MMLTNQRDRASLLQPVDRNELVNCLGLDLFAYVFVEAMDDNVLRALRVEGRSLKHLLEPWNLDREFVEDLAPPDLPVFISKRGGYRFATNSLEREHNLIEEMLPYPIGAMVAQSCVSQDRSSLMVAPKGLLWSLSRFGESLIAVERALNSFELSCLCLSGICGGIAFLTRRIGRRRVKLGRLAKSFVDEISIKSTFLSQSLLNAVGREIPVIEVKIERQPNLIAQLDHLALAFHRGLSIFRKASEAQSPDPSCQDLSL